MNPARTRCEMDGCGWQSAEFYGPAGPARAWMAARVHQRCPSCDGSRHRSGSAGELCGTCEGSGYRPASMTASATA